MRIDYDSTKFTLNAGVYYSPVFNIAEGDNLITVECTLNSNGSVSIEQAIDQNWFDVSDSSFTCSPSGFQSYIECQSQLQYRLKSVTQFINAKILL